MRSTLRLDGVRFGLIIYMFAVGFTDVFAINKWIPIPVLVLVPLVFIYFCSALLGYGNRRIIFVREDLYFLGFLFILSLSTIYNAQLIGDYTIGHLLSYYFVIGFYYLLIRLMLEGSRIAFSALINALTAGVVIVSVYGIYEFIVRNYFGGAGWVELPGRISVRQDYVVYYSGLLRSRSFMAESGIMALYIELIGSIVIFYYLEKGKVTCAITIGIILLGGLIVTFSVAALISLTIASIIALCVYIFSNQRWSLQTKIIVIFLSLVLSVVGGWFVFEASTNEHGFLFEAKNKVIFDDTDPSSQGRLERWTTSASIISDQPLIGHGVGSFSNEVFAIKEGGIVSFWLQIFFEGGVLAFILLMVAYSHVLFRVMRLPVKRRYGYLISLIAGAIHYAIISDYWKPWIWMVFALVIYDYSTTYKADKSYKRFHSY